jgi:DNA polymerase-3 subunit beta
MKAVVSTKELKKAVKRVALNKNSFQKSAKVSATDGHLVLASASFNVYTKELLKADILEAGTVYVNTEELVKVVKSLKSKTAEIYSNGDKLVIKAGIEFKLTTYHIDSFQEEPVLTGNRVILNGEDFLEGLNKTVHIISKKELSRFDIQNLCLNFEDKLEMVATDGHRLSLYTINYSGDYKGKFLIQKEDAELLKKAVDNNSLEIYIGTETAIFKSGDYLLSIQISSADNYPNYKAVFLKDEQITLKVKLNTQEFVEIVKGLVATEPQETKPIILNFLNNKLTISNASGNYTEIDTEIDKAFTVGFNGKYLLDALSVIKDSTFEMNFVSSDFQVEIRTNEPYKHILAPMKL